MMMWLVLIVSAAVLFTTGEGKQCPDGKNACPSSATCCLLNDGSFACCPYKDAECCEDRIHCCPSGTRCNMRRQSCDSATLTLPFKWMVPLYDQHLVAKAFPAPGSSDDVLVSEESVGVKCPDGNGCPDKSTCCQMPQGNYGCCPYPHGNCCSDQEHCCPSGYDCDVSRNRCIARNPSSFASVFFKAPKVFPIFNVKEDVFEVPRQVSCASLNLCDLKGLVCCSGAEGPFCCPRGTICSKNQGFCTTEMKMEVAGPSFQELNIFDDVTLPQTNAEDSTVVCPDKTESCPSGNTCCQMASGQYGCCPMPQATCCEDKLHCCPNGYVCAEGGCERQPSFLLLDQSVFRKKTPLAPTSPKRDSIRF